MTQLLGIGATIGWCAIGTLIILVVVDRLIGLRVSEEIERTGLDHALHGEQLRS
jgi:Amt family ammonium transporter